MSPLWSRDHHRMRYTLDSTWGVHMVQRHWYVYRYGRRLGTAHSDILWAMRSAEEMRDQERAGSMPKAAADPYFDGESGEE